MAALRSRWRQPLDPRELLTCGAGTIGDLCRCSTKPHLVSVGLRFVGPDGDRAEGAALIWRV